MSTRDNFISHFYNLPRLYHLTYRKMGDPKGRLPSIVSNHVKKYSDNYLIVREKNKKTDGYHHHCIFSLNQFKEIKKNFFRKGVHMHLQKLGDTNPRLPTIPESAEHVDHIMGIDRDDSLELTLIKKDLYGQKVKIQAKRSRKKKSGHVTRVIDYILKELPEYPEQYIDYIYVKKKRSQFPQWGK